ALRAARHGAAEGRGAGAPGVRVGVLERGGCAQWSGGGGGIGRVEHASFAGLNEFGPNFFAGLAMGGRFGEHRRRYDGAGNDDGDQKTFHFVLLGGWMRSCSTIK